MVESVQPVDHRFSPQVKAFLAKALPAHKGGSVLGIGEHHAGSDHFQVLKENWGALTDAQGNNVGTLGLELRTYMNVFIWAAKDGKLPADPGQELNYLKQVMNAYSKLGFQPEARADLIMQALSDGVNVIAFDTRKSAFQKENAFGADLMVNMISQEYRELMETYRNQPNGATKAFDHLSKNTGWPVKELQFYIMLGDVKKLLEENPQYAQRLAEIDKVVNDARAKGLPEDAQSAAVFAHLADPERNSITLSGLAHIAGSRSAAYQHQGTFAAHLQRMGMQTTPATLVSYDKLGNVGYLRDCASRGPMHLLVVDQDAVVDVSSREAIDQLVAKKQSELVTSALVSRGIRLTCDRPTLPTTEEVAEAEAKGKPVPVEVVSPPPSTPFPTSASAAKPAPKRH